MHSPSILPFDPTQPFAHFGETRPSGHLVSVLSSIDQPCFTVVPEDEKGWDEVLVWLPSASDEKLELLARQFPGVANDFSADYQSLYTLLSWTAPSISVRMNTWSYHNSMFSFHGTPGFGVAFFNATSGRYAAHYLGHHEAESFTAGLQGGLLPVSQTPC